MCGIIRMKVVSFDWTSGKFKLIDVSLSQAYTDPQLDETYVSVFTDPLEAQTFILWCSETISVFQEVFFYEPWKYKKKEKIIHSHEVVFFAFILHLQVTWYF